MMTWEGEVRWNKAIRRDAGLTPYREMAVWRRLALVSIFVNVALGLLLLLLVMASKG